MRESRSLDASGAVRPGLSPHDLLARAVDGVDALHVCARQDVETAVTLSLEVLRSLHSPRMGFAVLRRQGVASVVLLVLSGEQVVGGSSVVFLACIEVVLLGRQNCVLARIVMLHSIVFSHFAFVPLLPQVCILVLLLFKLLLPSSLICNCEILVESVTFYFKVNF